MSDADRKTRRERPASKVLEDRIAADGELVGQVLDPGRTAERVKYPDPLSPQQDSRADAPDSIAEAQMARRTDAGLRQSAGPGGATWKAVPWLVGATVLILLLLALALG